MMIVPTWAKLAAVGVALAGCFAAGWSAQGWRMGREAAETALQHAQKADEVRRQLQRERDVLAARLRVVEDLGAQTLREKQDAETKLRDRVSTGAVRLRVAAVCPGRLPEAPAAPGVDDGAAPELAPDARPAYHTLRAGLVRCEVTRDALQDWLRERSR